MSQYSKTDQRRISLLSLIGSAIQKADNLAAAYTEAQGVLADMEEQGFFEADPTTAPAQTAPPSQQQPSPPTSTQPTSIPDDAEACPNTANHAGGLQGFVQHKVTKSNKTYRQCSLRKREKRGEVYVDVGPCSWVVWD